jgi:phospholipase C
MVSEVLRILTDNPAVWQKTIFILTYDENDGYYDHVPPFVPPDPARPEAGKTTPGIDAVMEYWPLDRDLERAAKTDARGGPIGLGYRVPLVVASPWSRGGAVCSQGFDHTSVLQLLEKILTRKRKRPIRESNISAWRRAVCGDLSSVFQPAAQSRGDNPAFAKRDAVLEQIHKAQFQPLPGAFARTHSARQEKGVRPALPLPYELHAGGVLTADRRAVEIAMSAGKLAGSAFHVYTPGLYRGRPDLRTRAYAVEPAARLTDTWDLGGFDQGVYHLRICGPNGFLRELTGTAADPDLSTDLAYLTTGDLKITLTNRSPRPQSVRLQNHMYKGKNETVALKPGQTKSLTLNLSASHHWYDFTLALEATPAFTRRHAGHVETGKLSFTDPVMGGLT